MGVLHKNFGNLRVFCTVVILNLLAFVIGATFSWPSPSLPKLEGTDKDFPNHLDSPITPNEAKWIASIALLGAAFGTILPSIMIRFLGRKKTLLILGTPSLIGYIMMAFGSHVGVIIAGRFISGITLGAGFQMVPPYVGEISELKNRGAMGCYFAMMMAVGHLYNFCTGPFVNFQVHNILIAIFPLLFLILTFLFVEESPYTFVTKEDYAAAEKTLTKLRSNSTPEEIKKELDEITSFVKSKKDDLKFLDLFQAKALRKSLVICMGLAIFQQFSGVNAVMSYMQVIFDAAGSTIPPKISPIYVGVVQLLATFVTPQIVDRFGRKILLAISQFGLCISMLGLGLFFYLQEENYDVDSITWFPLLCLILFIIFFNTGPGSVIFVIMGEIFPNNAKNVSSTLTSFSLTFFGFLTTWVFPVLIENIDFGPTFWIFSCLMFLAFLMTVIIIPETKGKTFSEIQDLLNR